MAVKTWGDFEVDLERLLGRGGMGAVYMGRQISLDRPAAIKVLKTDLTSNPEFVKRFHREAALLARIVDNHVVQIFGAGEADGHHYYAMEYVEGEDYASRVKKGHKFTMDEVLKVGESVGVALQMAWRHRIVHRDIKPSNILLTKDNETKVMDFGLAKNPESDLTASEVIMGTAKYMSPEQATGGQCDTRSDLYSLGVVLYELSAGQPPFSGEGATAIMYQHVHKQPTPPRKINPAIPPVIEAMILRLIEKDPDKRYATPEALVAAVRGIQEGVSPEEQQTLYDETRRVDGDAPRTPSGGAPRTAVTAPVGAAPAPSSTGKVIGILAAVLILGAVGYFATRNDAAPQKKDPDPAPKTIANKEDPPPPPPSTATKVDPPPVPATTTKVDPPAPPPPKPADPWAESQQKGETAFAAKRWASAAALFEEALSKGAPAELTPRMTLAKARDEIEKAEKLAEEGNEPAALARYLAANRLKEDPELQLIIRKLQFSIAFKTAEKQEGKDWFRAAEEWKKAAELAPEAEAEEAKGRQKFCATFSDAVNAGLAEDWSRALALYKDLAKQPRAFATEIGAGLKTAEGQIARMKVESAEKLRKEFDAGLKAGQELRRQARWVEAKAKFEELTAEKFKELPQEELGQGRDEVALALKAPPGMIYVPGGKFQMGGGRAVESPAGEATVVPVYMDEREVRVAEYVEFLKALDSFGHTPACLKAEPPTHTKHTPNDWDFQKPEDPVTGIDWWDAASFAAWRKKRLPTEAEWEHAAGFDPKESRRLFPWGGKYAKEGGKSYLGFDGMSSSVIEWTADWLNRYPWSKAEHSDFGEKRRVVRGGVLLAEDAPESTKVTYRYWYLPLYRSRKLGFRCVQDLPEK